MEGANNELKNGEFTQKIEKYFECKYTETVVVIDPGWENLGVLVLNYCLCGNHDVNRFRISFKNISLGITDKCKVKVVSIALEVRLHFEFLLKCVPPDRPIRALIIEAQPTVFKKNVKLQDRLTMFMLTRYDVERVFEPTPMNLRNFFGLPCTKHHDGNKIITVNFIETLSKDIFLSGYRYNNNIADTILILNYYLHKNHKLLLKEILSDWSDYIKETIGSQNYMN